MNEIQELHSLAMALVDRARIERASGNAQHQSQSLRDAYHFELQAALRLVDAQRFEPSRSVLLRSAASLALQLGRNGDAGRLASLALCGQPSPELTGELEELLAAAGYPAPSEPLSFERHYQLLTSFFHSRGFDEGSRRLAQATLRRCYREHRQPGWIDAVRTAHRVASIERYSAVEEPQAGPKLAPPAAHSAPVDDTLRSRIRHALGELSRAGRRCFLMAMTGSSLTEVAAVLNTPEEDVQRLWRTTRRKLESGLGIELPSKIPSTPFGAGTARSDSGNRSEPLE